MTTQDTCSYCGSHSIRTARPKRHQYRLSGLDNVYLKGGVTRFTCNGCGETYTQIEAEQQLMEVIAVGLLLKPAFLSGGEMRFLRKACRFSQEELAKRLGITRRAIVEREKKVLPGLKGEQELGLRVVFFNGFMARLEQDPTHLHPSQMKYLKDATCRFLGFAEKFKQKAKKGQTTIARDERRDRWDFADPGRLAA